MWYFTIITTGFLGHNAFAVTCCFLVFLLLDTCRICTIVTTSLLGRMIFAVTAFVAYF